MINFSPTFEAALEAVRNADVVEVEVVTHAGNTVRDVMLWLVIGDVSMPDIRWTPRRKNAVAKLILDNDIDVTILKTFFNISQEELDTWVQKFRDVYQYGDA